MSGSLPCIYPVETPQPPHTVGESVPGNDWPASGSGETVTKTGTTTVALAVADGVARLRPFGRRFAHVAEKKVDSYLNRSVDRGGDQAVVVASSVSVPLSVSVACVVSVIEGPAVSSVVREVTTIRGSSTGSSEGSA